MSQNPGTVATSLLRHIIASLAELQNVAHWASTHPDELVILDFSRSVSMVSAGDDGYHSMARASLDELSDILLYYLGDVLISRAQIASVDPTINDLLSTGSNVLMLVRGKYLRKRSDFYL